MAFWAPFLAPPGLVATQVFPRCGDVDKLLCSLILALGSQFGRGSGPFRTWCRLSAVLRGARSGRGSTLSLTTSVSALTCWRSPRNESACAPGSSR
eukprot:6536619-Pyramimonas_sp.AAC.1